MNENLKKLMLEAGYAAPDLAPRAHKLCELLVKDILLIVESYCETSPEIYGLPLDILEHYDMEVDLDE